MNKQILVVVGIVEFQGKILTTRRVSVGNPQWHQKWEFPGGKVDAGESPEEAVIRELQEECGLDTYAPELLGIHTHIWHVGELTQQTFLATYRLQTDSDKVELCEKEADAYLWLEPEAFLELEDTLGTEKELLTTLYLRRHVSV